MNLRHESHNALLAALAILCTAATPYAQNFVASPEIPQVIKNPHQLATLSVSHPAPEYPAIAKVNYIEGPVQIEIAVDNHGRVSSAHVLRGEPMLAAAALKAVRHWVYLPLSTAGGPAGFVTTVKLKFSLHREGMSLTTRQAELDFQSRVKPPQVITAARKSAEGTVVHMRVLVNELGEVVDSDCTRLAGAQVEAVSESLRNWTFHPAYWGTLPIAAYINVDVPLNVPPPMRTADNADVP